MSKKINTINARKDARFLEEETLRENGKWMIGLSGMGGFKRDREEEEKQTVRTNCVYNIDGENEHLMLHWFLSILLKHYTF